MRWLDRYRSRDGVRLLELLLQHPQDWVLAGSRLELPGYGNHVFPHRLSILHHSEGKFQVHLIEGTVGSWKAVKLPAGITLKEHEQRLLLPLVKAIVTERLRAQEKLTEHKIASAYEKIGNRLK